MAKRKPISKRLRFEVFKRDRFTCQYCGRSPPIVILEIDHVVPASQGGDNADTNLLTSCFDCNRGKSDKPLDRIYPNVAEKMAEAQLRREQVDAYNEYLLEERARVDRAVEELGLYWFNKYNRKKDQYVFGPGREQSIKVFLERLPQAEILDAIDIAFGKKVVLGDDDTAAFKYFCGVCWQKIKRQG